MLIGLTYDLRDDYLAEGFGVEETAEFDSVETVESVENALQQLGFFTDRVGHVRDLAVRLATGERWDLVFNFAEGLAGFGREAQVPCLLDAYRIPYVFSDPLVLSLTLHKGLTKRVIRDMGIPTPDFAVVERPEEIDGIDLPYPLFVKPVAEGTGKGVTAASKVRDMGELTTACLKLLRQFDQPVLVETFLPGREVTVGITGSGPDAEAIAVMEVLLGERAERDAYTWHNKENWKGIVSYRLVDDAFAREAADVALAAWRGLGCRDGGRIDLRADAEGRPSFIEVNPLAGLRPGYSDLPILADLAGVNYLDLMKRIMRSALRRINGA